MPHCNLKCTWCDTDFKGSIDVSEEGLRKIASVHKSRIAVITGGEPSMNKDVPEVIKILSSMGYLICMESNGNFPPPKGVNFLTVSPKRFTEKPFGEQYYVHPDSLSAASEIKVVVDDDFDFSTLEKFNSNVAAFRWLSPEWGNFQKNVDRIMKYILDNPQWRISLQTHKFMNVQ